MSSFFLVGFSIIFVGHICLSTALQYGFYSRRGTNPQQWKIQPSKTQNLKSEVARSWWLPALGLIFLGKQRKRTRHPRHDLFATINLLLASTVTGTVTHLSATGRTRLYWDHGPGHVYAVLTGFVVALAWQSVLEYYWHRLMHLPYVYKRLHKYHHYYKSPEPFDDLMIHPLEAFGYYLQLYSPPFVFAMPVMSFMLYMMVCGTCGVLDHSGIKLSVPGIYDTKDHDRHHSRFEVNYAFPFPVMDVLHGTYDGCFLGRRYSCSTRERLHKWIGT